MNERRSHGRIDRWDIVLATFRSYLEGKFTRVLHEPPSVGLGTAVIVSATAVVVAGSGVAMWLLDHDEYPNVGVAMWWAAQTVTTVGYGDVSPSNPSGRILGVFVMLYGVAFVTVFVAAITSIFVARASEERGFAEDEAEARIEAQLNLIDRRLDRLDGIDERLERLERLLRR
jgi:voltage-gated potassium channel